MLKTAFFPVNLSHSQHLHQCSHPSVLKTTVIFRISKPIMTNSCQFCLQNISCICLLYAFPLPEPTVTVSNSSLRLPSFCSALMLYTYTVRAIILAELIIHGCALYLCCPVLPPPSLSASDPGPPQPSSWHSHPQSYVGGTWVALVAHS